MNKTAKLVKVVSTNWNDTKSVYQVSDPVAYTKWHGNERLEHTTSHILVSGVNNIMAHETLAFPCDAVGTVLDWGDIDDSYVPGINLEASLHSMGYEVVE